MRQISMFDMMKSDFGKDNLDREQKIENVIDSIRQKYGSSIINRAALIKNMEK